MPYPFFFNQETEQEKRVREGYSLTANMKKSKRVVTRILFDI